MAFLEAQASGVPVVAGRTGGVPAVVADGVAGVLTPIGDAASFAAAVGRLLDDPKERARLAANTAARIAAVMTIARPRMRWRRRWERFDERRRFRSAAHASTVWNEEGRLQGMTDTILSPKGEAGWRTWRLPSPGRWLEAHVPAR